MFRCIDETGRPTGEEYPCRRAEFIDRWGFYDKSGRMAIEGPFHAGAGPFSDGLASVVVHGTGQAGYIDRSGRFVIPPHFNSAKAFSEGLAAVNVGGAWGYINRSGRFVIGPQYESAKPFSDGRAAVRVGDTWGYINSAGRQVIPPRFSEADAFREGLAAVCCDEGFQRFVDASGAWAFELRLTASGDYSGGAFIGGVALVDVPGIGGAYIDRRGGVIAPFRIE